MTADLPLVIEFFDAPELVDSILGVLDETVAPHAIVTWPARCLRERRPAPNAS